MIFKSLVISFLLFIGIGLCGQNKVTQSKIYYNVEDGTAVCKIDTSSQTSEIEMFYYFGRKSERVSSDVKFIGGYQALTNYFDSIYFNRKDYNEDELNALFYYTILFDESLKIKEVKIIRREAYDNSKYNYDSLIKKILFSTEGKWEKSTKKSRENKWFLKFGTLKLK